MDLLALSINIRQLFLGSERNFFGLPVDQKHRGKIISINSYYRRFSLKHAGALPTKTHAQFIVWKTNHRLRLGFPVGWYMYGPFCPIPFGFSFRDNLNDEEKNVVEKAAIDLRRFGTLKLERIASVYQPIHEARLDIVHGKRRDAFVNLRRHAPPETRDLIRPCEGEQFASLWRYISLVRLRDSLRFYYGKRIDLYLWRQILRARRMVQQAE